MAGARPKRWWAKRPGRWTDKIEDALASGDPGRIGIAWSIIRESGGDKHGSIKAAAQAFGVDHRLLSAQLSGAKPWTVNVIQKIADSTGRQFSVVISGAHPLGVPNLGSEGFCEPGDANWQTVYAALRVSDPSIPSEVEIREREPRLFPEV